MPSNSTIFPSSYPIEDKVSSGTLNLSKTREEVVCFNILTNSVPFSIGWNLVDVNISE